MAELCETRWNNLYDSARISTPRTTSSRTAPPWTASTSPSFSSPLLWSRTSAGNAHERIVWADLADAAEEVKACEARVLLLYTGWSRHWNTEVYSTHPFVDADAARRLLDLGVKVLGLDTMSPDKVTADEECADVHHVVLGSGGVIVENLTGLETLVDGGWKRIVVSLLSLSLAGCDGSPIRAVAWEVGA
ncbi:hypothetical protein TRAPUB_2861 [Trametes pubescens]|uniref:Kynurenine formamidase n=1 Tax=Trametes pubescens TaxID=154538 RepID=A0A1M2VF64_TRAPU|nr:hypothetical protein TRAPUB_2861 [Trametes pubescens]